MASIIVRGLDDAVKRQLADQARQHGRSMEAEVRDILIKAAQKPHIGQALMQIARETEGFDLEIPERKDAARRVEFE